MGFTQSSADNCLFLRHTSNSFTVLLVYVDDVLITGSCEKTIREVKAQLHEAFTIKELGYVRYFLGIEIARGPEGTYINQRKYILDILSDTGLLGSKLALTPLPKGQ